MYICYYFPFAQTNRKHKYASLRLLLSLKPKEMAKTRLLAIWIDQTQTLGNKIVISSTQNSVTGSGLEGDAKLLKAFSRDHFYVKTMRYSRFQLGHFFVH